jgi:hypothetical protein
MQRSLPDNTPTITWDKHACFWRVSNPQSQQSERPQTHALDRAATRTDDVCTYRCQLIVVTPYKNSGNTEHSRSSKDPNHDFPYRSLHPEFVYPHLPYTPGLVPSHIPYFLLPWRMHSENAPLQKTKCWITAHKNNSDVSAKTLGVRPTASRAKVEKLCR